MQASRAWSRRRGLCLRDFLLFTVFLALFRFDFRFGFGNEAGIDRKIGLEFSGGRDVLQELQEGRTVGLAEVAVDLDILLVQGLGVGFDLRFAFRDAVGLARGVDGLDLLGVFINGRHGLGDRPSLALAEKHEDNAADKRKDQNDREDDIL